MSKTVILRRFVLSDLLKQMAVKNIHSDNVNVAFPMNEKSKGILSKINGEFKAVIMQHRFLKKHQKFFVILDKVTENGFLDRLPNVDLTLGNYPVERISQEIINSLLIRLKDESEVVRYLIKYLLLPLEKVFKYDGSFYLEVSSQAFEKMEELIFDEFFQKALDLWSNVLGISKEVLQKRG